MSAPATDFKIVRLRDDLFRLSSSYAVVVVPLLEARIFADVLGLELPGAEPPKRTAADVLREVEDRLVYLEKKESEGLLGFDHVRLTAEKIALEWVRNRLREVVS